MYLVGSESIGKLKKAARCSPIPDEAKQLAAYEKELDGMTKFIPVWVKFAVALCLGIGTMIGWKRIVVTIGEKIGKIAPTYAQGASAELGRDGDDLGRPTSRAAGEHDAHSLVGCRGHHGRERFRLCRCRRCGTSCSRGC